MADRDQVLRMETDRLQQEMLKSTQRTLKELDEAQEHGRAALTGLAEQNEQIDGIVNNLDKMRTDLVQADKVLQQIASPFAFLKMKKEAQAFETLFGAEANWSGPINKKRDVLPGYKKRYFVLLHSELMYFDGDDQVDPQEFANPRGKVLLKGASLEGDRPALTMTLRTTTEKWKLKCDNDNDFVGWHTMLSRHIEGKFSILSEKDKAKQQENSPSEALITKLRPQAGAGAGAGASASTTKVRPPMNDVDAMVDENLDQMLKSLDVLGAMALETKQALDVQNRKLDVVDETMQQTINDVQSLQNKHRKRLK